MNRKLGFLKFYCSPYDVFQMFMMTVDGYLVESGWVASQRQRRPVDKHGEPIPWFTTSFVSFLDPRLGANFRVFEFGAGNSTRYFARRVAAVTSVEDHAGWHAELKAQLSGSANVALHLLRDQSFYQAAQTLGGDYHLIVVDGAHRFECVSHSLGALRPDGVVVLDNSLRSEYEPIYRLLREHGFRHIDFWGMAGGSRKHNCTTLFYRPNNCLGV